MLTSSSDWSALTSENERLVDSRASQAPPRPAPPTPMPAPASRLRWRRRAALGAAAETAAAVAVTRATPAAAPGHRAAASRAFRQAGQ
jgi:hypothetical protein